jgi:phosphoesterase RecJ-like protein
LPQNHTVQDTIEHNLKDLKKHSGNIVITTHHKPDGDAMGSSLGLYNYLRANDISSRVITPSNYADFLHWLPGNDEVLIYEGNETKADALIDKATLIYCLDYNALSRSGSMQNSLSDASATMVLIDHHQNPEEFDNERFVEIGGSSTCELIYQYIDEYLEPSSLDKDTATCLFTGLVTDTGSFRFGSTTSKTLSVAANLMDLGVKPYEIHKQLFDNNRLIRLQFLGYFLANKIELIADGKVALAHLNTAELEKYDVITGDTEGFVNYGLSIGGVQLSALIIDRGSLVKMSFRSKDTFKCNEFAAKYFNGGGHINAAGGASKLSLEETLEKFKNAINNHLEEL